MQILRFYLVEQIYSIDIHVYITYCDGLFIWTKMSWILMTFLIRMICHVVVNMLMSIMSLVRFCSVFSKPIDVGIRRIRRDLIILITPDELYNLKREGKGRKGKGRDTYIVYTSLIVTVCLSWTEMPWITNAFPHKLWGKALVINDDLPLKVQWESETRHLWTLQYYRLHVY